MPSSTPVTAGDPVKASQYNSLITDMTTIETDMATLDTDLTADMATLETSVNSSIADLEAQTELLLLNTKVDLRVIDWSNNLASGRGYNYTYNNNSAITQNTGLGQMNSYEGNGGWAGTAGWDGWGTVNGTSSWVWSMSTSLNSSCTTQASWGLATNGAWSNSIQYGITSSTSYGYTLFRHNGADLHLYAVTRASSADTEEVEDLGLTSSISAYVGSRIHLKIIKDNFSPTPGVKYYINGVLVASHLHANSSGNNQYNNFTGQWDMGMGNSNLNNTQPSSGANQWITYANPMHCAILTT
tara:strand:- start:307 stop:1203 length:897 start_codon:yes stop_codon:yes gene_type:complete